MPAPLTSHQRNLFMAKRRSGRSQEASAAAAGFSVRSARRIEKGEIQPKAGQPRGRTRADPLDGVWQEVLVPLLSRTPALTPITLLEHLQRQKPEVGAFYWTDLAPDVVNSGREEQGLLSV